MTMTDLRGADRTKSNLRLSFLPDDLMQMIVVGVREILEACCRAMLRERWLAIRMLACTQNVDQNTIETQVSMPRVLL